MSICQNDRSGCAACCGVFNLCVNRTELGEILADRTRSLAASGRLDHAALVRWREERERIEAPYGRQDPSVYVCPFAGWIEPGRAGCLIHPERTGMERSQNASFYGATICQAYECPAREACDQDPSFMACVSEAVNPVAGSDPDRDAPLNYGRLAGDALLFRFYEHVTRERSLASSIWARLFQLRCAAGAPVTSFELVRTSLPTTADYLDWLFPDEGRVQAEHLLRPHGEAESIDGTAPARVLKE